MPAVVLPSETWIAVGIVGGLTVLACLGYLARVIEYEFGLRELVRKVNVLRGTALDPRRGRGASRRAARRGASAPIMTAQPIAEHDRRAA